MGPDPENFMLLCGPADAHRSKMIAAAAQPHSPSRIHTFKHIRNIIDHIQNNDMISVILEVVIVFVIEMGIATCG